MNRLNLFRAFLAISFPLGYDFTPCAHAESPPQISRVQRISRGEIALTLSGQPATWYLLQAATNLSAWNDLATFSSSAASSLQYTDSAAPFLQTRYYRVQELVGTNFLAGDHLQTTNGDVIIQPFSHASFVLSWQDKFIYVDPTNSLGYPAIPKGNLVLVTHSHPDHFNTSGINAVRATNAFIVAPQDVYNQLLQSQKTNALVLAYGASTNLFGVDVQAVAAYNSYHPTNFNNAYLLTIGGRRIFISGDTSSTPEIRALTNIDLAFVCMNQPYTMTVPEATNLVTAFHPSVVYPYHYRDQSGSTANASTFKQQLRQNLGIEVRLRKWY